jgi:hypothetical protein
MLKTAGIFAVALGLTANVAQAQQSCQANSAAGCSVNTTASVVVPAMIELTVAGTGTINLTSPDVDALTGGFVPDVGPAITVRANRRWTLSVHTTAATEWLYSGTESGVKPITDLTWSSTSGGTYAAITTSAVPLVSNQARTNAGAASIFFRTLYSSDLSSDRNAAGTYSLPLVFTLTAP